MDILILASSVYPSLMFSRMVLGLNDVLNWKEAGDCSLFKGRIPGYGSIFFLSDDDVALMKL